MYMLCIYFVYIMYILCIYYVYIMYILCTYYVYILVYIMYILCIYVHKYIFWMEKVQNNKEWVANLTV
jgi:hypothetical protein